MAFQAIVHAPVLRPGARLCFSDLEQTVATGPARPTTGDRVALRFGACCPDLAWASIEAACAETLLLRVATARWQLRRGADGVTLPGLVSENWHVVQSET